MRGIITGLLFAFPLIAQPGDYSISGVVVNAKTGEPVKYALVTMMGFRIPDSQQQPGKFQPLPSNRQTERDLQRIFDHGTETELTSFLRKNGVPDGSERFVRLVKLYREHVAKRR